MHSSLLGHTFQLPWHEEIRSITTLHELAWQCIKKGHSLNGKKKIAIGCFSPFSENILISLCGEKLSSNFLLDLSKDWRVKKLKLSIARFG